MLTALSSLVRHGSVLLRSRTICLVRTARVAGTCRRLPRLVLLPLAVAALAAPAAAANIPATRTAALDGRTVTLPGDLPAATILILGFTRRSADATTAWERPTRTQLAQAPAITFFDMAMLAEVPRFARGFALGRVRKAVPDVLKPNFLALNDQETEWKRASGFDPRQQDAAYVMLVDRSGAIRWSTHAAFTPALFAELTQAARSLSATQP